MSLSSEPIRSSRSSAFLRGAVATLPLLVGAAPFGLVYGALATGVGLSPALVQAMSAIVFAGSAQFVIVQMLEQSTPLLVILLTATIINLRHVLYSASIAPFIVHLGHRWKGGLAYLLTDEAYAIGVTHYQRQPEALYRHWYLAGAGLALWSTWQASTAAGIVLGYALPADWSLDFAIVLTFIALLVPAVRDRLSGEVALVAGLTAVLVTALPLNLGLLVATLVGIVVGMSFDRKQPSACFRDQALERGPL
ncbi:MAG: AzlC family ABC transporter permease [Chloroflexaceae bacterium]|nr:AzlC family ABC transporter permease [Chloroflexaceae bacterium]